LVKVDNGKKGALLYSIPNLFISHLQPQLKPNPAEVDHLSPNAPNAVPKVPKGKDEYSGHLPQVCIVLYTGAMYLLI